MTNTIFAFTRVKHLAYYCNQPWDWRDKLSLFGWKASRLPKLLKLDYAPGSVCLLISKNSVACCPLPFGVSRNLLTQTKHWRGGRFFVYFLRLRSSRVKLISVATWINKLPAQRPPKEEKQSGFSYKNKHASQCPNWNEPYNTFSVDNGRRMHCTCCQV